MKPITIYGIDFYVKKTDKGWAMFYKDVRVDSYCKTKKDAISQGTNKLLTEGKDSTWQAIKNYNDKVRFNRFIDKVKPLFKKIFNVEYPIDRWHIITGRKAIDAIRFDSMIGTPAGISTYDYVLNKYGNIGLKLLKKVI